jgi:hypothetical protein
MDRDPEAMAKLHSSRTPKAEILRQIVNACAENDEKLVVFSE